VRPAGAMRPMTVADLDEVMAIETGAYSFPWSRGNFTDSLQAGHWMDVLESDDARLCAYGVAMTVVDELHILNLTVAASWRRQGLARAWLEALAVRAAGAGLQSIWLEVRVSNEPARALYRGRGFVERGLRRHYYPTGHSRREDAVIMALNLGAAGRGEAVDAAG